jgi:hypothetical protein
MTSTKKTYSVLFSAPWHDTRACAYWVGLAADPKDAINQAVFYDLADPEPSENTYGKPDGGALDEDVAQVTIVWLCEGELPAFIHT